MLVKHGFSRRDVKHPLYSIWMSMKSRCGNPNDKAFRFYGGRGIKVCDRWKQFPTFLADVGERPAAGLTLDRIDNNGNYEPGNTRWATRAQQQQNTRRARQVLFRGRMMPLVQAATESGLSYSKVCRYTRNTSDSLDAPIALRSAR